VYGIEGENMMERRAYTHLRNDLPWDENDKARPITNRARGKQWHKRLCGTKEEHY
jgi:hypothetical protein